MPQANDTIAEDISALAEKTISDLSPKVTTFFQAIHNLIKAKLGQ